MYDGISVEGHTFRCDFDAEAVPSRHGPPIWRQRGNMKLKVDEGFTGAAPHRPKATGKLSLSDEKRSF